ncbi:hypothetical protein NPIL_386541 [Nephila pilipes]|uniref:Uncharacterized protein n=1 Tax=Nephila pilipes TaxID=299642 RepID=A0A8X6J7Z6_NEPPI|nr:hypothetical protein NPIL_386541 [Nephila pilipes]
MKEKTKGSCLRCFRELEKEIEMDVSLLRTNEKILREDERLSRLQEFLVQGIIGRSKELTDILDICECLITDRITESIIAETYKYNCSLKPNYFRSKDAMDTDGAEIETLFGLLYLAGVYHENRVFLEEFWRMDKM